MPAISTSLAGSPPAASPDPSAAAMRWSADRLDQLERAVRDGLRVSLTTRRGTEYVVIASRLATDGPGEALVARLPMTGEELRFPLDDITAFHVLGRA